MASRPAFLFGGLGRPVPPITEEKAEAGIACFCCQAVGRNQIISPDPKWLAVLEDSDNVVAAAIACGLFLLANHWGWLPPLNWANPLLWVWCAFLFFGSLSVVKVLGAFLTGLMR